MALQAPVPLLQSAVKRWQDFITYQPIRVAVGIRLLIYVYIPIE
jgi:hypothetical protein